MSSACERLRAQYPTFVYEQFTWRMEARQLHCRFQFRCGEHRFAPQCTITFPSAPRLPRRAFVDNLVFHLGLAELPSYWKATCSPRIELRAGALSAPQIAFWTSVLTEGMGEFHFVNRTSFTEPGFVAFENTADDTCVRFDDHLRPGHVVPIGGGKDSLLTLELLRRRQDPVVALAINPPPSTLEAVQRSEVPLISVQRTIDPSLLALNRDGYLNGHTPFGAVIAFQCALAAAALGLRYVTLSNEASADHATVEYRGRRINHQYGKSSAFEAALHRYFKRHVASDLYYFSLLRPFNELQIAQGFAGLSGYHDVFRSCNRGRKTDSWCGRCAKCWSTFLVLAPFMGIASWARATGITEPDPPADLLSALLNEGEARPFECVATPSELGAAYALVRGERLGPSALKLLTHRGPPGLVPQPLYDIADAALQLRTTRWLGRARVGVLGLGVEGRDTVQHLLTEVDELDLTIIDDDPTVKEQLPPPRTTSQQIRFAPPSAGAQLDLIFKSPGVASNHPALAGVGAGITALTSNTALFFERCRGLTIGVTGTKGKSTTTSLIAHVLRAGGKDARLVGNIGRPCLSALSNNDPEAIYCVELSSFQLEHLKASPSIAVVLGIFPDHLDRHGDLAHYVAAKSAIARYQQRDDLVLYNRDCPRATQLAKQTCARSHAFNDERPPHWGNRPAPLLGRFNHYNTWPAIVIARHFGIGDATISQALRDFVPLPGRLETVALHRGVRFICDIRSTAPEVTVAALEALHPPGVDFLMLGGVDRGQDYRSLLPALERSAVRHIILFPPTGHRIRDLIANASIAARISLFDADSMEHAIDYVYRHATDPSVCLMSTAAPSNGGLFAGPKDKARQFEYWAAALGTEVRA